MQYHVHVHCVYKAAVMDKKLHVGLATYIASILLKTSNEMRHSSTVGFTKNTIL